MNLDVLVAMAEGFEDEDDKVVEHIASAIVDSLKPEQVGRFFDDAIQLPQPFESWDDKAIAWLFGALLEWISKVDLSRDPVKVAARQKRRQVRKAARRARRDPLWLLKQALRNAKHPEAIASIERAIAMESK
jgi:hypothetical protein